MQIEQNSEFFGPSELWSKVLLDGNSSALLVYYFYFRLKVSG